MQTGRVSFVQVVAQAAVASERHALFAAEQTLSAFRDGSNLAKQPELEFLLRLSGKRQIAEALKVAGLKEEGGTQDMCVVIVADNEISLAEIKAALPSFKEKPPRFPANDRAAIEATAMVSLGA